MMRSMIRYLGHGQAINLMIIYEFSFIVTRRALFNFNLEKNIDNKSHFEVLCNCTNWHKLIIIVIL